MTQPLHHQNKRRRIYQKLEKYPHPNKYKRFLDYIIYLIGIVGPIMTIPQLHNVWGLEQVTGVSLVTWSSYMGIAVIWLLYGLVHKDKPIIVTQILWFLMDSGMVAGILVYT